MREYLIHFFHLPDPTDSSYLLYGQDCFVHLCRVTAGLDSSIWGETEIQGQVKRAYHTQTEGLSTALHQAFQAALKIGKNVRHHFSARWHNRSLAALIWQLAERNLGTIQEKRICLIGYSEMNRSFISFCLHRGVTSISLITKEPLQLSMTLSGVEVFGYEYLSEWETFDLILSATKAKELLIRQKTSFSLKPDRQRLIFDLSIPRTVDPSLAQEDNVRLWNIDDLRVTHPGFAHESHQESELFLEQAAFRAYCKKFAI